MIIRVGSDELPVDSIFVKESVFEYTAYIEFTTAFPITQSTLVLDLGETQYDIVPVRSIMTQAGQYKILCYPKSYVDFLNNVSQPIEDECDLTTILDTLAVCEHFEKHKTQSVFWRFPTLRGKSLIDQLIHNTLTENGGCPTFHFTLEGVLFFSDLLSESYEEPSSIFSGTISTSKASTTFMNEVAGKVNFIFYDEDTVTEHTSTFLEGTGELTVYKYLSDSRNINKEIAKAQSTFWRRLISNSSVNVTNTLNYITVAGIKTTHLDSGHEYIILGYTLDNSGQGTNITLDLYPATKVEQTL